MKKTFTITNLDGTTQKVKVDSDASILTKRGPITKVLFGVIFVLFAIYSVTLLFPFFFLLVNCFKGSLEYINDLNNGTLLSLPNKWHFENFVTAFTEMKMVNTMGEYVYLPVMFFNSIWISFTTVFCGLTASAIVAYPLAKYRFKLRGFIYGICIFNMTIPVIGSSDRKSVV